MAEQRPWSVLGDHEEWDERDDPAEWEHEMAIRRRERRLLLWLVVAVLVAAGALYSVGYASTDGRIARGSTIAGIDVGGLTPRAAQQAVSAGLEGRLSAPIRVRVADQEFQIDPRSAGLDVDVPASVAQVPVASGANPAEMWESVVGGADYPAVVVTIGDLLEKRLRRIAGVVGTDPVDGAITFTEQGAQPVYPTTGETLDVRAAAAVVADAFLSSSDPVPLTLRETTPRVSATAVSLAMRRVADRATSAPVVYDFGPGREVVVRPTDLPGVLSMQPRGARLVPVVDPAAFAALVAPQVEALEREPRDAEVVARRGRLVVVPAVDGRTVPLRPMVDTFPALATAEGEQRTIRMTLRQVRPEVTTAQAERQRDTMRERD